MMQQLETWRYKARLFWPLSLLKIRTYGNQILTSSTEQCQAAEGEVWDDPEIFPDMIYVGWPESDTGIDA
jgi:hypothetical protein